MCQTCGCSPCSLVQLRRGPAGDDGAQGDPGENAQVLYGAGDPDTVYPTGPTPPAAYALYGDTDPSGNWWTWDGSTWSDTGVQMQGAQGNAGTNGENARTVTALDFIMPAANGSSTVIVAVASRTWATPGQVLYVQGAGYMRYFGDSGPSSIVLINLENTATGEYVTNTAPGATIAAGAVVVPGGLQGPSGQAMQVLSDSGDPTVTNPSGPPDTTNAALYADTGVGGNWWTWDGIAGGPWVDTGVSVSGPAGAAGAAGHTPELTMTTSGPSGGVEGDWHIQQVNGGKWQVYYRDGGGWVAFVAGTMTAGRFLGYGAADPNTLGLIANANDVYFTTGSNTLYIWMYNGVTWINFQTVTGGGGGAPTFNDVAGNSVSQLTGVSYSWNMQTSIQYVPTTQTTSSPGATTTFQTFFQWNILNMGHDQVINYVVPAASRDCFWVFELVNTTAAVRAISYTPNRWSYSTGVTHPVSLAASGSAGDRVSLICRYFDGYMNIVAVQQNTTVI